MQQLQTGWGNYMTTISAAKVYNTKYDVYTSTIWNNCNK